MQNSEKEGREWFHVNCELIIHKLHLRFGGYRPPLGFNVFCININGPVFVCTCFGM